MEKMHVNAESWNQLQSIAENTEILKRKYGIDF